jgi:hypothetical protein
VGRRGTRRAAGKRGGGRGRRGSTGEEALNGAHEGVEGGAGVALPEVGGGKAAHEAVDAEATHGLVAEAEAGVRVTPHDEAPPADNLAVLVDGKDTGPKGFPRAASEDTEVVGVLEVLGKHDVAEVQEGSQLGDRKIPHTPGVLILVGNTGVKNEAPPRGGCFVHGSKGLDEEWEGAAPGYDFDHALPSPGSELGAESDLGGLVPFPAGVVRSAGVPQRHSRLGHDHPALDYRGGDRVERAQAAVPLAGGHENRHDVAGRLLLQADVLGKKA